MPDTNQPDTDPMVQFAYHLCGVCAIAILTLALEAAQPNDPTPLALLPLAAITRWIEEFTKTDWMTSGVVLDIALGMMTGDIIASWT